MKYFYSFLLTTFVVSASAQQAIPKGAMLLGGDLSLWIGKNSNNNNSDNFHQFYISPSVAKAIKPNLFLGGSLLYSNSQNPNLNTPYISSKANNYGIGFFIRKYKPVSSKFYVYLNNSFSLGHSNSSNSYVSGSTTVTEKITGNNLGFAFAPGISFKLSSIFHLEAGFRDLAGLSINESKFTSSTAPNNPSRTSSVNLYTSLNNFSSQLYLGFRVLLENGRFKEKK